jgi:hypothetical protein
MDAQRAQGLADVAVLLLRHFARGSTLAEMAAAVDVEFAKAAHGRPYCSAVQPHPANLLQLKGYRRAEIIGIKPRQMRRIRWRVEHYGLDAVMDQRGGRPRRKRIKAGAIEFLCRLKRDVYPDFSLRHFFEFVTEKHGGASLLQLTATDAAGSRRGAERTGARQVPAPARATADGGHADTSRCLVSCLARANLKRSLDVADRFA